MPRFSNLKNSLLALAVFGVIALAHGARKPIRSRFVPVRDAALQT